LLMQNLRGRPANVNGTAAARRVSSRAEHLKASTHESGEQNTREPQHAHMLGSNAIYLAVTPDSICVMHRRVVIAIVAIASITVVGVVVEYSHGPKFHSADINGRWSTTTDEFPPLNSLPRRRELTSERKASSALTELIPEAVRYAYRHAKKKFNDYGVTILSCTRPGDTLYVIDASGSERAIQYYYDANGTLLASWEGDDMQWPSIPMDLSQYRCTALGAD